MTAQLRVAWRESGTTGFTNALFGASGLMATGWQLGDNARQIISGVIAER